MQLMDQVRKSEFLGREFFLWLWFKSETSEGRFDLGEGDVAELWVDRKIVLQYDDENGSEKITCSGDNPYLKEARFALTENKQITEMKVKLIVGDNEWSFALDSTWMNFKSFRTPKVMQDFQEDPDGLFYEKMYLVEKAISTMDAIFIQFINLRLSTEWDSSELPLLLDWIRMGK